MYFTDQARARLTVDSAILGLLRLFSASPQVRVLALAYLEQKVLPSIPDDHAALKPVLAALQTAVMKDLETDAQDALAAQAMATVDGKDTLPN